MSASRERVSIQQQAKNFLRGGLCGMFATSCIQPIDITKVRIQLYSEAGASNLSPFKVAKDIYKEGGMKRFYIGLDSALLRQATYATLRLGLYFNMTSCLLEKKPKGQNLAFWEKCFLSLSAGGVASFFGTPFDLALVRVQSDATVPFEQRRHYKHAGDALLRITKEEGISNLWRGATPTVVRAMVINLGMLAPFDECKERTAKFTGGYGSKCNILLASAVSGFLAAFLGLPFDNVKTKLQKQVVGADGKMPYNGIANCLTKTIANEGLIRLWAGFPTFYFRVAPHTMITWVFSEFLRKTSFFKG